MVSVPSALKRFTTPLTPALGDPKPSAALHRYLHGCVQAHISTIKMNQKHRTHWCPGRLTLPGGHSFSVFGAPLCWDCLRPDTEFSIWDAVSGLKIFQALYLFGCLVLHEGRSVYISTASVAYHGQSHVMTIITKTQTPCPWANLLYAHILVTWMNYFQALVYG